MAIQLLQKHNLPECSLRISRIMKRIEYLFQSHNLKAYNEYLTYFNFLSVAFHTIP